MTRRLRRLISAFLAVAMLAIMLPAAFAGEATTAAEKEALTGTVTIAPLSPTIGTTLTATYADGNGTGAATYTWTVGTATVVTGTAAYTAVPVDAGKSVTVSVSFADQTGSVTSAATSAVAKKDFAGAVTAPEEQAKTATSVTLKAVQGYEYAKAAAGDAVPTVFADSAQFGGLTANTTYDFYQRAKETADTKASAASAKTSITTGSAPSGASLTVNKVINLPNDTETQIDYVVVTVNGAVKGDVVEIYTSQAQGATPIATQIITATAESQKITINLPENALSKRVIGKVFVAVKDKVAQVAANYAEEISLSISKPVMSVGYPSFCDITFPQGVSIKSGTDIVWKSSMIYAVTIQSHDNERATLFGAGAGQSLVSATGKFNHPDPDKAGQTIKAVAEAVITVRSGGGGTDSGTEGGDTTSFAVYYDVGAHGTISGATSESVVNGRKPARVPNVVAASGYLFKGWSINGTTIVIPQMYTVRSSTTFKAVYEQIKDPQLADEHKAYIGGYSDGTFRPENKITRAEAVAMFARIMKTPIDPNATYTNKFTDVPSDKWFANAVGFMSQFGIIGGYTDGSFRPNNIVTRAEFAAMIVRFNNVTNSGKSVFSDVADSFWGKNDIMAAYNSGWITGYSDGTFRPQVGITRAETVKVVNTMLGRVIDASSIAGAVYKTFSDVTTKHWAYYYVIEASCDHGYTMENGKEIWARG